MVLSKGDETLTVKPAKPRNKLNTQTYSFSVNNTILKLKMTPSSKTLLLLYLRDDPQSFLNDMDYQYFMRLDEFSPDNRRGHHYKRHAGTAYIKHLATRLFVIARYWTQKDPEDAPPEYFEYWEAKHLNDDDDQWGDNIPAIVQTILKQTPTGKTAQENGVRCFDLRPADFKKTYISSSVVKKLRELLEGNSSDEEIYKTYYD